MTFTGATATAASLSAIEALVSQLAGYTLVVTGTDVASTATADYTFTFTETSPTGVANKIIIVVKVTATA